MALNLTKLQFDPSSPSDPQRVGAFLIGAGGTVITETGTALDVNLASSDLLYTGDAVGAVASDGPFILGIRQDAGGSPVSADGDYHPLVFNNDGELKVAADLTSSVADDDADSGNPIKVGGRGVDGLLTALSASNDRFDMLGDMYRRLWVNSSPNVGTNYEAATVGITAAELVSTPLAGRRMIEIQNLGSQDVYIGFNGSVTTANGFQIPKNATWSSEFGEDLNVFAISGTAGQDVRIIELA